MLHFWYKNAVLCNLDVEAHQDSLLIAELAKRFDRNLNDLRYEDLFDNERKCRYQLIDSHDPASNAGFLRPRLNRAHDRFNRRFWHDEGGYFCDIVDGDNGDIYKRDAAYHQATIWSWLIRLLVKAWCCTYPNRRDEAMRWLDGLTEHLGDAFTGQISKIFAGNPPHEPTGCLAQAWGIAELPTPRQAITRTRIRENSDATPAS